MDKLKKILATAILCAMPAAFAQQKYELTPADSPVERLTSKRSQMVLNGVWECAPMAVRGEPMPADGEWGKMLVPGFYFADIEKKPRFRALSKGEKRNAGRRTTNTNAAG